ncbi:MAG: ATP-dependent helicase [Parcubacteria group bacterium]|nr:ATP-dependent helicase [Parcubacteria group bacterium]
MDLKELLARFEGEELEFRTKFSNDDDKDRDIKTITSFFNGRGGTLLFGITEDGTKREIVGTDLPPQVIETGLTNKLRGKCEPNMRPLIEIIAVGDGKHVIAVRCHRGKMPPYSASGTVYVRHNSSSVPATDEEISDLYKQRTPEFDRKILDEATLEDLDTNQMRAVFEHRENQQVIDGDLEKLMVRNGLVLDEGNGMHPTIAGIVLFGQKPQHFVPHTSILFQIQNPTDPNVWDVIGTFDGNIFHQIDQIMSFLTNNLRRSARIVGFERKEELEIPVQALREAVVNAVVHRDYHDTRAQVQISIAPSYVRIVSPGGLVAPLTMREIEQGRFNPTTRNPVIASTLLAAGLMDKRGTGIPRMTTLAKHAGLASPEIRELTGGTAFEVIFPRKKVIQTHSEEKKISLPPEVIKDLDDVERKILLEVEKHKEIKPSEVETVVDLSRPKVNEILASLVQKEILQRIAQSKHDPHIRYALHERFTLSTPLKKVVDKTHPGLFDGLE